METLPRRSQTTRAIQNLHDRPDRPDRTQFYPSDRGRLSRPGYPLLGREQKVHIQRKLSHLGSKFVTEETSRLLPQTSWHLVKPPINFIICEAALSPMKDIISTK